MCVYSTEKLKHKSISLKPLYAISDTVNNCIKCVVKNLFVSLKYQLYRRAVALESFNNIDKGIEQIS